MKDVVNFPANSSVHKKACEFMARIDRGNLTAQEEFEIRDWLSQSELHREELGQVADFWGQTQSIMTFCMTEKQKNKATWGIPKNSRVFESLKWPAVVVLPILLIALFLGGPLQKSTPSKDMLAQNGRYTTTAGQQKTVMLNDGSEIQINTSSEIIVNYDKQSRNVILQKGEAFFTVASDPSKPFTVFTSTGSVQAVGTAFSVRQEGQFALLKVSEGRVKLRRLDIDNPLLPTDAIKDFKRESDIFVGDGESVEFNLETEKVVSLKPEVMERQLLWRKGFLAFEGEPLSKVLEEVSRYSNYAFIIDTEKVKDLPVSGYYPISKLDTIFSALEFNLGVKIEKTDDNTFRISS